ncbi:restriction endonuclease subunit S [Aequorivita flava]|uniref:Restriction endonuclease subunit S n=1 Tax=Aequorivita flava TaxID=3114371 RepID=A0AB35YPI2_9FLAO
MSAISATISLSSIGEKSFTIKEGYKKTKLGWIPEDWETPRIDEVFDFLSSNSLSRNQLNYEEEEGIYNIHYGDIHATYKRPILDFENESRVPKINKEIAISQTSDFLKDGDLVVADASEDYEGVGEAIELKNVNERKVISGLHTFAFRDKTNKTAEGFRVYIFRNPLVKKALKTIATGSKVYGISKGNLQKFKIVLPTLPEQQKIATILSTWDSVIAKQEQLIIAKQEFKKGLMQLLLTGKKRFEGFEGEWEEVKLSSVSTFTNGKAHEQDISLDGEFVVVNSKFISTDGKVRKNTNTQASPLKKDDIVMVMSDVPNGKALAKCYIIEENERYSLNQRICSLKAKKMDVIFLWNQLNRNKYYLKFNDGISQTNLKKKEVLNCPILRPEIKEQQKIASVLSAADKEIGLLQSELATLRGQKRGLMQRLLTGEVRVEI